MSEPLQWVDPNIGAIANLLAVGIPTVQLPHGMIRLAPNRAGNIANPWLADRIQGFPLNIISHRGARAFTIMAAKGDDKDAFSSEVDHAHERANPYEFTTLLEDSEIEASYTVTEHAMIYKFTAAKAGSGIPDIPIFIHFAAKKPGTLEVLADKKSVRGQERHNDVECYFHAEFNESFESFEIVDEDKLVTVWVRGAPVSVEVRIGFSFISHEQARENMEREVAGRSFAEVSETGRTIWNNALSAISVEGGTERERRIFYTALWRCHERQINITESGKYFSAYDGRVHEGDAAPFYVDDWIWDTHRGLHPLRLILDPDRERDILESYARIVAQGKDNWAPVFPLVIGNRPAMLGNHCAAVVADAYAKGLRGFDIDTLYAGVRKNSTEGSRLPHHIGHATELDKIYDEKGFFPGLAPGQKEWVPEVHWFERRQSVSVTLEHSYDDWCIAVLANALGREEDAQMFAKRALYYRNLFNEKLGVMAPKSADGEWIEPYNPELSGGEGGRDYFAECTGLTYSWSVPHDVAGLIALNGGRGEFVKRLDHFFNHPLSVSKWGFMGQFPDSTGLIGHFPMGNEPSFHIPFLYLYAGAPWRTQRRVRQCMDYWFGDTPHGICGDDDGGAMSAWYVFNSVGFYPLCPGRPIYGIGSPIFERARIRLGSGGEFTVIAKNVSTQNKYVQSAKLNGEPLDKPWFTHDALKAGGSLVLQMGPRPNKEWGAKPEDAPPSM